MERLGESFEWAQELLGILRRAGWDVDPLPGREPRPALAGEGVLVTAVKGPYELRFTGATFGDAASDLFHEATRILALRVDEDVQMVLV